MGDTPGTLRPFYADWAGYNRRWIEGLARLTEGDLALVAHAARDGGDEPWPIWAIAGHCTGTRVFWFCDVFGEPGAEPAPFGGGVTYPEDDLSHPRSSAELVAAFESTWQICEGVMRRWTPDSLDVTARRASGRRPAQVHTRQSILLRMISHEAYHLGEVNLVLGSNGREPIDPWPGRDWEEGSPRSLREG
jgi:hypothetical protein